MFPAVNMFTGTEFYSIFTLDLVISFCLPVLKSLYEPLKYFHGKFFTAFLLTDTSNHFASCYTSCFHTFSDMHVNRGSEWGLVFSVIWP